MKLHILVLLIALNLFGSQPASAQEVVSIESLLNEMVDRDGLSRFPAKNFRLKQHSSYNRASVSPEQEKGWFTNRDYNTGKNSKNFIRVEENDGRKEWVMMDHQGPGAIVRSWQPFKSTPKNKILRIYLDGSETPVLEGNPHTLFNGQGLIPFPLAHQSLKSAVNFFPIPYAKSCKVTMSSLPYFFIFTFREYDEGTKVKTFTMDDFEAAQTLAKRVGESLLSPQATDTGEPLTLSATLNHKDEQSLKLPSGTLAVRELSVKLGSYEDPNVTRQVVLKMEFDGKQTVWCPIGDFFGSGMGLNPMQGWSRTVSEDGTMSSRWVMPYQSTGKVTLVNFGKQPVKAELTVKTGDYDWGENSMYFHAGWRGQYPVATRPRSDWNYITTSGKGVYVGDTLTIMNPVPAWWGEGDAKIWVDGEDFPSLFGTGTEDYYAYSWGGLSTDFYEHPFHAQPLCNVYNQLNRKTEQGERDCRGFSVETRSRALDTIPFGSALQLDMEVWSVTDCDMGYQVGAYWYGFANTTSNHKPDGAEVLNIPPLPNMSKELKFKKVKDLAPTPSDQSHKDSPDFDGAIEVTPNLVTQKPEAVKLKLQNLKKMKIKGSWNLNTHQLFKGTQAGDVIEIRIPATGSTKRRLSLHATKSKDFGIIRLSINGKLSVDDLDLYSAKVLPTGAIDLGSFAPVDDAYTLRVEVVGRNRESKNTLLGLDCVTSTADSPNETNAK